MFSSPSDYIPEYAESEHFLFLAPEAKEHAEGVLAAFCERAVARGAAAMADLTPTVVEAPVATPAPAVAAGDGEPAPVVVERRPRRRRAAGRPAGPPVDAEA